MVSNEQAQLTIACIIDSIATDTSAAVLRQQWQAGHPLYAPTLKNNKQLKIIKNRSPDCVFD